MADKKCPKCGSELSLREGYGVCNGCGEIVAATDGEEIKATVAEETTVVDEVVKEISEREAELFATQIPEEFPVEETVTYSEEIEEQEVEEQEEPVSEEARPEETFYVVPEKKKGKSVTPVLIIILCAMLTVGAYYVVKDMFAGDGVVDEIESFNEDVPPEIITEPKEDEGINEDVPVFDEPVTGPIESLEGEPLDEGSEEPIEEPAEEPEPSEEPEEKPQDTPATKPAEKPVAKPAKKPATSVQKPAEEKPVAPAVAYRVRKSANDSKTQIGAFADLEKAKNFARGNASDGYKVFDMNGNLVFAP